MLDTRKAPEMTPNYPPSGVEIANLGIHRARNIHDIWAITRGINEGKGHIEAP